MRKVYIKAYTRINLGDDLFIKALCERYPEDMFYIVASKKYKEIFKNNKNLIVKYSTEYEEYGKIENREIRNKKIDELYEKAILECDCYVYIGGSIFIEPRNKDYSRLRTLKKELKTLDKSFIIGANFGPYESDEYKSYVDSEIIDGLESIAFRDMYSYELFKAKDNVAYAPDIVFSMDLKKYKTETKKEIGISIIDHLGRKELEENYKIPKQDNRYNKILCQKRL